MFPNGWPGRGLLVLRLLVGILLIHDALARLLGAPQWDEIVRQAVAGSAGILLLIGLWTPVAGVLIVFVELWSILWKANSLRDCMVFAALGAALAMLGPGVSSVDARLFGRKQIEIQDR